MTTLFEATWRLAFFLMPVWESAATGGTVASLTDTLATFRDDHVGGTLWIRSGDLANKTLVVTAKTSATVLAFATQTPDDIAAGNLYALADQDYNRALLRRCVNEAIREYGPRRTEDATLETVADQEEYTLPTGVSDVKEVWVGTSTTSPYDYWRLYHWDEVGGELVFPRGFAPSMAGYKIKLVYRAQHADLTTDAGVLPVDVSAELIHWAAAVHALVNGLGRFHGDPKRDVVNKATKAEAELLGQKRNWHPWTRDMRPADY